MRMTWEEAKELWPTDVRIEIAEQEVRWANENLKKVRARVPAACKHPTVAEFLPVPRIGPRPRRVCLKCGLSEEGSYWSGHGYWSRADHVEGCLDNKGGRRIVEIEGGWEEAAP